MKIGFEVFLVVAREMSITKAANELHITQQCASDHIKRLEKEYNVVLFERRPKFRLTQAGGGDGGRFYLGNQYISCANHTSTCAAEVLPVLSEGKHILYGGGHTDSGGTPAERTGGFIYRGQYVAASRL